MFEYRSKYFNIVNPLINIIIDFIYITDSQHSEGGFINYGGSGHSCFPRQGLLFCLIWIAISLTMVWMWKLQYLETDRNYVINKRSIILMLFVIKELISLLQNVRIAKIDRQEKIDCVNSFKTIRYLHFKTIQEINLHHTTIPNNNWQRILLLWI